MKSPKGGISEYTFDVDRPLYCKDIHGGFKPSAKMESILTDLTEKIPKEDKVLILSFFKGSLDLIEGVLYHELGMDYARFDGDLSPEERQKELDRFRQNASCRVLLASVQTGGTGLNIVEVNISIGNQIYQKPRYES